MLVNLGTIARSFTLLGLLIASRPLAAQEDTIRLGLSDSTEVLALPLAPGVDEFQIFSTTNLAIPFTLDSSGTVQGYEWTNIIQSGSAFYQVRAISKDSNAVLNATVLNRLAYGPTPDELEHLSLIGPSAYVQEQLAPEQIEEQLAIDVVDTSAGWRHVVTTGTASSSTLYLYLETSGDCYIDDLQLVKGGTPEVGSNILTNGNFEAGLNGWTISTNLTDSVIDSDIVHSGSQALHIVQSSPGTTKSSSIWQTTKPSLTRNGIYTLSYWYKPGTNLDAQFTARLSGSGIDSSPNTLATRLEQGTASISDLSAWHVLHAVQSKKQLLEVLLQFLENHFVTQYSKSRDYLGKYYGNSSEEQPRATHMEYMENKLWRQALQNPQCTFYDLLKISAESPAMIIYLDTVNSKGNGSNIANENYARELLELFTFGVDNGYDQNDITIMSRAWTGWTIQFKDDQDQFDPFASQSKILRPGMTNLTRPDNLVGDWGFYFKSSSHNTSTKTVFPGKIVPARFGAPYAGRSYELQLPARTGTNGIQDGYDVLAHLANQPFTQEFISVKLCRLFVHEDFATGYDFTDPNLSPEGRLIRSCMDAWENSSPKGQVRKVLETIFNSELFQSQAGSMQKVKTPLEFTVSAIRALRAQTLEGGYTANTDGYSIKSPLDRMGRMRLFDRDTPDGYPEAGASWISAGTLAERLRFVQALLIAPGQSGHTDAGNSSTDPVGLLKAKLSSADWSNADQVADYFLSVILPSEGKANLNQLKQLAVDFLNTADDGTTTSLFNQLDNSASTYDTRVRGMVAMIMTSQRFQEQ
jgi:uncharacterized protein (DUF1800 family)